MRTQTSRRKWPNTFQRKNNLTEAKLVGDCQPVGYKAQLGYYADGETGLQLLTHRYYDPSRGRFLPRDPVGHEGGFNLYSYVANNPLTRIDRLGHDWYDTWERWADIRETQKFWQDVHDSSIRNGDWISATGADIMNGLISGADLPDVQRDGEILGSDASTGDKIRAGGDLVLIGASWYYGITGGEIVPEDPKVCRIAPAGNRAWRPGWEPPRVNQLPHYQLKRPGPGGSYKWHRPWEKGF
jgi:RHS repeat-associated protein